MDYNTQRPHLRIPEYGRITQQMVDHCCSLANKEERNKAARTIVAIMENMNPEIREEENYKNKLWDQLAEMSGFNLDIDWPYDVITKEVKSQRPDRLPYSDEPIRCRHYGKISEAVLQKLIEEKDEEKQKTLFVDLANFMKRSFVQWKRELIQDDFIFREIVYLTEGAVQIPEGIKLGDYKDLLFTVQQQANSTQKKKKKVQPQPTGNPQKKKKKH